MDSQFGFPASPGLPLFAVSPERANRQPIIAQSPSLPADLANLRDPFTTTPTKVTSDVQGKVAQYNNISNIQRRKDNEAAVKRAIVGREEAESETRRIREENRVLRREIEEGRGRERKVAERLEVVMDELRRTKETNAHSQALYEKEIRRARKEAFKASSALVKLQQELKSARNKFTLMREEVDVQRRKVEEKEQETFSAQYQLVGLQEEIETFGRQRKAIEEERDALKTSLKEEEVARIAAEGRIALPVSREGEEFASPKKKKNPPVRRDSNKENIDPEFSPEQEQILALKEDIRMEKRIRQRAEDQVHFMKMECQFQCCSCRVAELQGVEYVHDEASAKQTIQKASVSYRPLPLEEISDPFFDVGAATTSRQPSARLEDSEPLIKFSPTTGTFYKTPSPQKRTTSTQVPASPNTPTDDTAASPPSPPPHGPSTPALQQEKPSAPSVPHLPTISTPFHRAPPIPPFGSKTTQTHTIRTTTTTVPLIGTPAPVAHIPFSPDSSLTREQALEQIRARRGRARSVAAGQGTPRRPMVTGVERRDVSAPSRKMAEF
ncbi:hypothetical protein MMC07_001875 [Pseudocyphellaria aurata]|nr:hypothetical protein [Pseudocyphellaria aurata]